MDFEERLLAGESVPFYHKHSGELRNWGLNQIADFLDCELSEDWRDDYTEEEFLYLFKRESAWREVIDREWQVTT